MMKGFWTALAICVASFLLIYFVFPNFSERFFGTSFKYRDNPKAKEEITKAVQEEIPKAVRKVTQTVEDAAGAVIDKFK